MRIWPSKIRIHIDSTHWTLRILFDVLPGRAISGCFPAFHSARNLHPNQELGPVGQKSQVQMVKLLEACCPKINYITSHQIKSHQIRSHQITSDQIIVYHITSDHITSDHIRSHHIRSGHIILYYIIYYVLYYVLLYHIIYHIIL